MPKAIFNGQGGLSKINRNQDSKYSVGDSIDPFRDLGYIKPSFTKTSVGTPNAIIKDIARRTDTTALAINAGIIYYIKDKVFDDYDGATFPYSPSALGDGLDLVFYPNTNKLIYIGKAKAGQAVFTDPTVTLDDDHLSTIPNGADDFSASQDNRPYVIWNNYLLIGDGRYVVKFDGQTSEVYTAQYFDVGEGFVINSLFVYSGYLGIVCKPTVGDYQSQILLIDGSSATAAVRRFTVNEKITVAKNEGTNLFFFTEDLTGKGWIKQMGQDGLDNDSAVELRFENASTGELESFAAPTRHSEVDIYDNKLAFASSGYVFVLGNGIISKPFKPTGTTITAIKLADSGNLYVASYTTTTYYFEVFSTGNSTATLKFPYKDSGQKIMINYVKYYFKPLVSGDSATVGLEIDYGTSVTLKDSLDASTIAYATDGAITSKKFKIAKECFSFRPTLTWTAGGNSLSYVVVDYSYINDI